MFWLLARELARRGHEIEVVTSDSLGPEERAESLNEQLETRIRVRRYRNRFNALSARLPAVFYRPRSMRRALREAVARADVVHMGESRGIHNLWTAQAASAAGRPLAWSAFGGLPPAAGVRGIYRSLHDVFLTRQVVPHVDAFIAQTPHERAIYAGHGAPREKIHDIPLCVDLTSFEHLPERGSLRRRIGLGREEHLVVAVARLAPVKGLDVLIDALAAMPANDHGPHLALVGWDHGSLPALRAQASRLGLESRVHFPGALYGDDRLIAYSDGDVFCLAPAVYEETSLAALEAAAAGCPTVLTAHCEIPGLREAGGGIVVSRDPQNLARAVDTLLRDGQARARMGELARRHVQESFSVTSVGARHEELFRELTR